MHHGHRNECLLKDNVTTEGSKGRQDRGEKDKSEDSEARDQKTSKWHEMSEILR